MKKLVFYFMISLASLNTVKAQESMVSDISYSYLDTLIATAKRNNPQAHIADEQMRIAKTNITKTKIGWLSVLNLTYFYTPSTGYAANPATPTLGGYQLGITLNVGTLLQNPYSVKAARGQYQITQFQQEATDLNLEAQVKIKYFAYIEELALLKLRTKSTQDAADLAKQLNDKFLHGQASLADCNSASLIEIEQNQYMIVAQNDAFAAKASLEELIGTKLENIH